METAPGKIQFKLFCRACEDIYKASQHDKKISILQKFIAMCRGSVDKSSDVEIEETFYPILRCLLPALDKERGTYGVKEFMLGKMYVKILCLAKDSEDAQKLTNFRIPTNASGSFGDFADTVFWVVKKRFEEEGTLTLHEVNQHLDDIASKHAAHEPRQVENILQILLVKMSAIQQKWLIRLLLKDMRLGVAHKKILNVYHQDANDLYDVSNSLKKVCQMLNNPDVRLHEVSINLFDPFAPMLSQKCDVTDVDKIIKSQSDFFYVDTKLDGERFQLHWDKNQFKYFSRKGNDYTDTFGCNTSSGVLSPHLTKVFKSNVESCILDGEMMCYNKKLKSFTTKAKNIDVKHLREGNSHRPCFCAFDVLYLNSQVLTNEPLEKRLEILEKIVVPLDGIFMLTSRNIAKKNEILKYLNDAIDNRDEGIVVKDPRSIYKPGVRTAGWYKIKPEYTEGALSEFDLLIIGGYYGKGKKRDLISHFLMGLMENNDGMLKFTSIGRVGSGCKMEELEDLSRTLATHWIKVKPEIMPANINFNKEKPDLWIEPESSVILQIKATEIVTSNLFKAGTVLRFPRIQKVRYDKPWNHCMTVEEFNAIKVRTDGMLCQDHIMEGQTPNKVRKAQTVASVSKQFRAPDLCDVTTTSEVLEGKEFCVMSDCEHLTKAQIERKIHELGGSFVQNPGNNTFCVLANDLKSMRVNAIQKKGEHSIIKTKWMLYCFNDEEFLNWTPEHVLALSKEHKILMDVEYDTYGDSFTKEATVESLRSAMDKVELNDINVTEESFFKFQKDLFSEVHCFKAFGKCLVYFDDLNLDTLPTRNFHTNSVLEMIIFKFNGGTVCKEINNDTTHVLVHSSNPKHIKKYESINSQREKPFLIVKENWVKEQIKL
ncbi:DNA ligase 4 [Adelges cooleyi]|uniref:DNA ligase 4 n=1 Tax=Adelges cooleyi TaxID=133065 RepID=UPI0021807563|nr:DNA ligase 4 [Adelges cooleyi]